MSFNLTLVIFMTFKLWMYIIKYLKLYKIEQTNKQICTTQHNIYKILNRTKNYHEGATYGECVYLCNFI